MVHTSKQVIRFNLDDKTSMQATTLKAGQKENQKLHGRRECKVEHEI